MYVCQLSLLQLLIWAGYRHLKERLPEAICCCLQTCNVDVVLLIMYCMYIPGFIVTSADISQLWVYLCYLLIYCLRLFIVVYKLACLWNVGDIVLHMCTNLHGHLLLRLLFTLNNNLRPYIIIEGYL